MCGLPPYVDEMIDLFVDDDVIYVGVPRLFTRPLRLTAREGFSLLAAGRAALQLPGADPTGRWPGRSTRWPRRSAARRSLRVDVAAAAVPRRRPRAAVDRGRRLAITYFVANRGERTERVVDPLAVVGDRGHWYLQARRPPVGRGALVPGRPHRGAAARPASRSTTGRPPATRGAGLAGPVRRRGRSSGCASRSDGGLGGRALPGRSASTPDGATTWWSSCPCSSTRWLERLLLRLGPTAEVLEPPELRDVGRDGRGPGAGPLPLTAAGAGHASRGAGEVGEPAAPGR